MRERGYTIGNIDCTIIAQVSRSVHGRSFCLCPPAIPTALIIAQMHALVSMASLYPAGTIDCTIGG